MSFIDKDSFEEGHAEGEEKLHFYYNREERLKNAPQSVKDYYSGAFKLNKGFRVLVSSRSNRLLLFTVVLCIIFVLFTTVLSSEDKGKIGKIPIQLTAFAYDEEIYVSLKINASKQTEEIPVKVTFYSIDVDKQSSLPQEVFEIYKGDELFVRTRFSDYDILSVRSEITVLDKTQMLKTSVQRK